MHAVVLIPRTLRQRQEDTEIKRKREIESVCERDALTTGQ
jgi:hypothetical protein